MTFALDPRLDADTDFVTDWPLCRVLLMGDARYPWLVLVPRRAGLVEIADLPPPDRAVLMEEIVRASEVLRSLPGVAKLNVGALGNVVRQLHVHVIARRPGDPAGAGPVWGHSPAVPYEPKARNDLIALVRTR
ncbi:MAG TPA: HIT domain-containing protein [Rhizomicrobium sp.]|jgi:diadenosine tetraphosphate (Ap4A) HIT family hydrolase|nr:HIT domain-containing protein [Rhizomicrobium sp.]